MCVFKYHAFIFYMRPPRWRYGTLVVRNIVELRRCGLRLRMPTFGCIIWLYAIAVYYNMIFAVRWWEATRREKTLGEIWAAVIKTINSILQTSVASNCALPGMGTEPESEYSQKGTMKDVLAICLKKTEAQVCTFSIHACYLCNEIHNFVTYVLAMTNVCYLYNNRCLFFAG